MRDIVESGVELLHIPQIRFQLFHKQKLLILLQMKMNDLYL